MATSTLRTDAAKTVQPRRFSLTNFWHPIGTSDEVTETPRQFRLLGENLVAFRSGGTLAVFKDLCIHRGTALSLGRVIDGVIECPYHGWQYDASGTCVRIPSLPPGQSIPRKARAIPYRAAERYGLVWVAIDEPIQPIPEWPDDAYDDPAFHTFVNRSVWKTSAGRACENGLDLSHLNFVHKGYTELADGPEMRAHAVDEVGDFKLTYSYIDGNTRRDYTVYSPFTLFLKKYSVGRNPNSTAWDAANSPEGGITFFTQMHTPRDETTTEVFSHFCRNYELDTDDKAYKDQSSFILDQDRVICESQRPEEIPTDLREELHLKVPDATGIAYRRMLGKIDLIASFLP